MKPIALFCLLVGVAQTQTAGAPASIAGAVSSSVGGEQAAGFRVMLWNDRTGTGLTADITNTSYSFRRVDPGSYRLTLTAFYTFGLGPEVHRFVTLAAGQKLTLDFAMPSLPGSVEGFIQDENGHPVEKVRVHASDKLYSRGVPRYLTVADAETDEHGVYRLERLPADRSLLVWADGSTKGGDSPADTFFPGTASVETAEEIVLSSGENRKGIDIRRITRPSYCIDGLTESGAGFDAMGWDVVRASPIRDRLRGTESQLPAAGLPLQEFAICGMHSGRYQIGVSVANMKSQPPQFKYSEGTVTVLGADLHGVRLGRQPPANISGETVWDGPAPSNASNAKLIIHFSGTHRMGGFVPAEPGVPEQFSLPIDLLPEDYLIDRVEVTRGKGVYIKDVTWNGQYTQDRAVDFGDPMADGHMRILVASDGASVRLRVADKFGAPASNAYIAMIPESAATEAEVAATMIFGQADQNGNFSWDAVPPGRYRVLATDNSIDGAVSNVWSWPTDLAAHLVSRLSAVRALGEAIEIDPNSTVQLKLPVQSIQ